MIACPPPRCTYTFKNSYLVGIFGTPFQNVDNSSDCSTGLLLLTDDPGLVDIDDDSLGTYLDSSVRIRTVSSLNNAAMHWNKCSSTYRDLITFFQLDQVPGSRSGQVQIGYVDRGNGEKLIDAWDEITKCPVCAWTVVPTLYKTDGNAYFDTIELFDLAKQIRADKDYDIKVPTAQASILFNDIFETTSEAAKAAQQGVDAEYVLLSYYCDVERDENCDAVIVDGNTVPLNYYSNDALIVGAIASSYSQFGTNYNFTENNKPIDFRSTSTATGIFLNETTNEPMSITEAEATNLTGINGFIAGAPNFVEGATRSVNGFFRFKRGVTYLESLRVNRQQFADVWYKEKAFRERLENVVISYKSGKAALGLSMKEALELAGRIHAGVVSPFIANNVINPAEYDWGAEGYTNILLQGGGYVITLRPLSELTQATISQRNGYTIGVCVIINEPNHRIAINLCDFPVISTEV